MKASPLLNSFLAQLREGVPEEGLVLAGEVLKPIAIHISTIEYQLNFDQGALPVYGMCG